MWDLNINDAHIKSEHYFRNHRCNIVHIYDKILPFIPKRFLLSNLWWSEGWSGLLFEAQCASGSKPWFTGLDQLWALQVASHFKIQTPTFTRLCMGLLLVVFWHLHAANIATLLQLFIMKHSHTHTHTRTSMSTVHSVTRQERWAHRNLLLHPGGDVWWRASVNTRWCPVISQSTVDIRRPPPPPKKKKTHFLTCYFPAWWKENTFWTCSRPHPEGEHIFQVFCALISRAFAQQHFFLVSVSPERKKKLPPRQIEERACRGWISLVFAENLCGQIKCSLGRKNNGRQSRPSAEITMYSTAVLVKLLRSWEHD